MWWLNTNPSLNCTIWCGRARRPCPRTTVKSPASNPGASSEARDPPTRRGRSGRSGSSRDSLPSGTILVTGGAGYIGSHVVRQLGEAGEKVIVLDNLGRGFRQAVTTGELVVGDVRDQALVSRLLTEHGIDTVMHFAAHTIVPQSVAQPLKYYGNNTCSTRALLQVCVEKGIKNFVFS